MEWFSSWPLQALSSQSFNREVVFSSNIQDNMVIDDICMIQIKLMCSLGSSTFPNSEVFFLINTEMPSHSTLELFQFCILDKWFLMYQYFYEHIISLVSYLYHLSIYTLPERLDQITSQIMLRS